MGFLQIFAKLTGTLGALGPSEGGSQNNLAVVKLSCPRNTKITKTRIKQRQPMFAIAGGLRGTCLFYTQKRAFFCLFGESALRNFCALLQTLDTDTKSVIREIESHENLWLTDDLSKLFEHFGNFPFLNWSSNDHDHWRAYLCYLFCWVGPWSNIKHGNFEDK